MTTDFKIHEVQLGKARAAKHMMLINGITPVYNTAEHIRHTVMPNGMMKVYGKGFVLNKRRF